LLASSPCCHFGVLMAPGSSTVWEELLEARKRPRLNIEPFVTPCESNPGRQQETLWGDLSDRPFQQFLREPNEGITREVVREPRWGEFPDDAVVPEAVPTGFVVEFQLSGGDELRVRHGLRLTSRCKRLAEMLEKKNDTMVASSDTPADQDVFLVDMAKSGLTPRAVRGAVKFLLADRPLEAWGDVDGVNLGGPPGQAALGSPHDEARKVEDAVRALECMSAASFFGLRQLEMAAEAHLLERGGLSLGTVLPLFAHSFGKHRTVSRACLRLLTDKGKEILEGRERQFGVLFATHPAAASVLAGIFSAVLKGASITSQAQLSRRDRVVQELLYGPGVSQAHANLRILAAAGNASSVKPITNTVHQLVDEGARLGGVLC